MSYNPDFCIAGRCSSVSTEGKINVPSRANMPAPRIAKPIFEDIVLVTLKCWSTCGANSELYRFDGDQHPHFHSRNELINHSDLGETCLNYTLTLISSFRYLWCYIP